MKRSGALVLTSTLVISSVLFAPQTFAQEAMPTKSSEITGTAWTYAVMNNALWGENTSSIQPWADEYKKGSNRTNYFMHKRLHHYKGLDLRRRGRGVRKAQCT